jgi:O-antigen/teichoic acid export membrane protein
VAADTPGGTFAHRRRDCPHDQEVVTYGQTRATAPTGLEWGPTAFALREGPSLYRRRRSLTLNHCGRPGSGAYRPNIDDSYPAWRVSRSRRPSVTSMSPKRFRSRWPVRGEAATRATTTMIDQGVASASNFVVGIAVARIAGPSGLGAFALAYTVWILLTMLYRAMITEPMVIMGENRRDDKDEIVRQGVAAVATLGVIASCFVAAVGATCLVFGQHTFGVGLLSMAPWILALDLQDYWRQIGFMQASPRKSLLNDLVFNAVQAMAFGAVLLEGLHSVFAVISAWGIGATVAALYGFWQFSIRPTVRKGWAFLRSRWATSRWLASERTANWGAGQLYLIVAGALLGPAALGGLKAAQGLVVGPTNVVINGSGSFGLPEASRHFAERGWVGMAKVSRMVTGPVVLAAAACAGAILATAPALLRLLYGPEFVTYAPCARIFAVSLTIYAFSMGSILNLTVTRQVRPLFMLQVGRLAFSVASVCVFSLTLGVRGAATADLLTSVVTLTAMLALQSWARRSFDETHRRHRGGSLLAIRRRLVRNAMFLIMLAPNSTRTSDLSSTKESSTAP